MKILHLVFHPDLEKSRVNKIWKEHIEKSEKVAKSRDLYKEYKDFKVDVEKEQKDLVEHDKIVIQFPFYWYSSPSLLKQWLDDVLTYNFAYGEEGNKLAGKELQLILSVGGDENAYTKKGYNNFSVEEFLIPLQQTATLCKMVYLNPLYMHRANAVKEDEIKTYAQKWIKFL